MSWMVFTRVGSHSGARREGCTKVDGVKYEGISVLRSFVSPLIELKVGRENDDQLRRLRMSHQK